MAIGHEANKAFEFSLVGIRFIGRVQFELRKCRYWPCMIKSRRKICREGSNKLRNIHLIVRNVIFYIKLSIAFLYQILFIRFVPIFILNSNSNKLPTIHLVVVQNKKYLFIFIKMNSVFMTAGMCRCFSPEVTFSESQYRTK